MMGRGEMFGKIIAKIIFTRSPVDEELTLVDTIADPEKSHIHTFGLIFSDVVIDDTAGS